MLNWLQERETMWPDVIDMRDFYGTSLGHVARRMIRKTLREMWPDVGKANVLGIGYVTPFIRHFREEARRFMVVMPSAQGALSWSRKTPNVVTLADEYNLPLRDKSIDYVLIAHTLEYTPFVDEVLKEAWRVLADGGRLVVVVPNRRGIWPRFDTTPFGHGIPYTPTQIKDVLKKNLFTPLRTNYALYVPPSQSRVLLSTAYAWENLGGRWFRHLSGVIICEAVKQVYGGVLGQSVKWSDQFKITKPYVVSPKI